jgi:hypothetical protein
MIDNKIALRDGEAITFFRPIAVMWARQYFAKYSSHSLWIWAIFHRMLSVPQNTAMSLNNVMNLLEGYNYLICDIANVGPAITHPVWRLNDILDVSPPPTLWYLYYVLLVVKCIWLCQMSYFQCKWLRLLYRITLGSLNIVICLWHAHYIVTGHTI